MYDYKNIESHVEKEKKENVIKDIMGKRHLSL
jgi:hypothetical protein